MNQPAQRAAIILKNAHYAGQQKRFLTISRQQGIIGMMKNIIRLPVPRMAIQQRPALTVTRCRKLTPKKKLQDTIMWIISVPTAEKATQSQQNPRLLTGVYQISTANELYWFAQQVNGGNTGMNAELTKDIIVNSGLLSSLQFDESGNIERICLRIYK